ncbi:unnamed protein product [Rotaria magnacalcarata]|uniref:Uncharacterized protein n=1 Tax=Rotaria magnacalcarata TaxID=392030 RepID=A0A816PSI3_9BILA|nr:unnamed protein product [Rotaria magnacalcarata]
MTSGDTLSPAKFAKQVVYQIYFGVLCSIRGFLLAWNNNYVWKNQQRSFLSLLICTIIIYIILFLIFLPFRLIVWFISLFYTFSPSAIEWFVQVTSAQSMLFKLLTFVPLLAVFIMNNLLGYDKLFFSVLASVNPSLAERINSHARQSFMSSLYFFVRRTIMMLAIIACIHFLRSVPYVGSVIPALWVFKYARYTITNTKNIYLRTIFFTLLVLLTIFKSLHTQAMSLLHLQMASTALARELFDTYLSRIHTKAKIDHKSINIKTSSPPSRYQFLGFFVPSLFYPLFNSPTNLDIDKSTTDLPLPHRKITHFLRENYFLLLAFAFPYVFLFSIPLAGFFCIERKIKHHIYSFMDRQEFFQSYMDHWGITDVLLDCYVDLLIMEMIDEKKFDNNNNNEMARLNFFKRLLFEHHIKCREQQVVEDEIHQLEEELKRMKK